MEIGAGTVEKAGSLRVPQNVELYLDCSPNRDLRSPLLNRTLDFVRNASRIMGDDFSLRFEKERKKRTGLQSPPSASFLRNHGLHLPHFAIYDSQSSKDFFAQTPFPEEGIEEGSLLLVFVLPPLLARRNAIRFEDDAVSRSTYKWENFGVGMKKALRKNLKSYEEKLQTLKFEKINEVGEHDSSLFHYVWEVSLPQHSFYAASKSDPAPAE